jgi:hypothetical protein
VLKHANPRLILHSANFYRDTERRIVVDLVRARLWNAIQKTVGSSSVTVGVDVWKSEESRDSFVTTTLHAVRRDFSGLFSCIVGALPIEQAHTGDNICEVAGDGEACFGVVVVFAGAVPLSYHV